MHSSLMRDVVLQGDCLDVMAGMPAGCVDLVLCDLPYGATRNGWDSPLPLEPLWAHWWRLLRPVGAVVLTASQPFSSALVLSAPRHFRHEWIWHKDRGSNFANTRHEPMKEHEHVLVFYRQRPPFHRQMQQRTSAGASRVRYRFNDATQSANYGTFAGRRDATLPMARVPSSVQRFAVDRKAGHPTAKPVALFAYLIRTYTDPGAVVLDNCAGSGTTAVACLQEARHYVLIEQDPKYVALAHERIAAAQQALPLAL